MNRFNDRDFVQQIHPGNSLLRNLFDKCNVSLKAGNFVDPTAFFLRVQPTSIAICESTWKLLSMHRHNDAQQTGRSRDDR